MSIGIYIHIPFCQGTCNYCHFITLPFDASTAERYQRAATREIEIYSAVRSDAEEVDSIYFGGGTPSLLSGKCLAEILDTCRRSFCVSDDCEISLEANPETISAEKAALLQQSGVTRVSLGAQSFQDRELASIGRLHGSETIVKSLHLLRKAGYANINLDLLLGVPGQTVSSWEETLNTTIRTRVSHISVYILELDKPCRLKSLIAEGRAAVPEDDLISDLYLKTIEYLGANGMHQYEISNFAQPGAYCRHNLKYWQRDPVIGFGLGSHSYDGQSRYANTSNLDQYLLAVESGNLPVEWRQYLSKELALEETLYLGLRLNRGVDWNRLQQQHANNRLAKYELALRGLVEEGLVDWNNSVVRLTPKGMLLSNEVFQLFV